MSAPASAARRLWCCEGGLEHCHEAWVIHVDGHEECADVSCRLDRDAHHLVVSCTVVALHCCPPEAPR